MTSTRGILPTIHRLVLRLFQILAAKIFSLVYGGESEGIATPKSSILMESATSLAGSIRKKQVTSYEVVKTFVDRITEVNPTLNSVVDSRFEKALEEAREVDRLIASDFKTEAEMEEDLPLLGVPFTAADAVAVAGLAHTGGLRSRKDHKAEKDAAAVDKMRKAGAIPLAVTNVSEVCLPTEANNPAFGRTRNPYNTNRTAGGSSGGEASLITSCSSPLGLGADVCGGVRIPGAYNGIFAHKPSSDTTAAEGLFPKLVVHSAVGPMSRFAEDLRLGLKILATTDLNLSEDVDVRKLKYFYMEDDGGGNLASPVDAEIRATVAKVVDHLRRSCKADVRKLDMDRLRHAHEMCLSKMTSEYGPATSSHLVDDKGKINVAREILKAPFGLSQHTVATLQFALLEDSADPYDSPGHRAWTDMCSQLGRQLEETLGTDGVFIYPTTPTTAPHHYEGLFSPYNYAYAGIFNVLGLPATQCPAGMSSAGLPLGIQLVAGAKQDRLTLAVAREIEKALGGWEPSPTKGILVLKNRALIKS